MLVLFWVFFGFFKHSSMFFFSDLFLISYGNILVHGLFVFSPFSHAFILHAFVSVSLLQGCKFMHGCLT